MPRACGSPFTPEEGDMVARLIAIGTAALILTSASVARAGDTFKAELSGDNEVPP
jgi:hypothetical protein